MIQTHRLQMPSPKEQIPMSLTATDRLAYAQGKLLTANDLEAKPNV